MTEADLLPILARGEDSRHQFKRDETKSSRRNPTLTGHATHILPYRGLGSSIPRALDAWPQTVLHDDPAGNEFKAVIPRPASGQVTPHVTPQVGMLLRALVEGEMTRQALQDALGLADREHFRTTYLAPHWSRA